MNMVAILAEKLTTSEFWVTNFFETMYQKLFGTDMVGGVNVGFWLSMAIVCLIVLVQNVVFWCMRPKHYHDRQHDRIEQIQRKREEERDYDEEMI